MLTVRGIIHCHSHFSHDGQHSLEELCQAFKAQGFKFAALTEHSCGINKEDYAEFVAQCKVLSSEDFVLIPGLEILCPNGAEIAGVGLEEIVEPGEPDQVVAAIRHAGGFSIWVHPQKRGALPEKPYASHAIELLNGKEDGTVAPNLALLRRLMDWRKHFDFFVIMGLDLHVLGPPLNIWTECRVPGLSAAALVEALLLGEFSCHGTRIDMNSSGVVSPGLYVKIWLYRSAYVLWNRFLQILPESTHRTVIALTRPLVRKLKRRNRIPS